MPRMPPDSCRHDCTKAPGNPQWQSARQDDWILLTCKSHLPGCWRVSYMPRDLRASPCDSLHKEPAFVASRQLYCSASRHVHWIDQH